MIYTNWFNMLAILFLDCKYQKDIERSIQVRITRNLKYYYFVGIY